MVHSSLDIRVPLLARQLRIRRSGFCSDLEELHGGGAVRVRINHKVLDVFIARIHGFWKPAEHSWAIVKLSGSFHG